MVNPAESNLDKLTPVVRLIASYRLLCACFIYFSVQAGLIDSSGLFEPLLYQRTALVYTVGAMVCLLAVLIRPRFPLYQYLAHLSFDLIVLGLIFYYSGGTASDHTILPIMAAAFSLAVLPPLQAFGVVATCVVILLGIETWLALTTQWSASVFAIGVNGLVTMGLMPLLFWLNARLARAEQRSKSAQLDYQQLAEVNREIINYMSTGCLIVNDSGTIVHINPSACALFATRAEDCIGRSLADLSEPLHNIYQQAGQSGQSDGADVQPIRLVGLDSYVLPHFFRIERGRRTVVLLDNLHQEIANIQQSRLATFGKMIHALMHEITNPLATIEQALGRYRQNNPDKGNRAQEPDKFSSEIVPLLNRQIKRIVDIVRGTRNLLPNRRIDLERINLLDHIDDTIEDLALERPDKGEQAGIQFEINRKALRGLCVRFDATHLSQVLANLIRNSIEHSQVEPGKLIINMRGFRRSHNIELEYWDNGVGIDTDRQEEIYRAFYSSDHERAGLGLHICNELCQLNGAVLEYTSLAVPARFRISLPCAD